MVAAAADSASSSYSGWVADGRRAVAVISPFGGGLDERGVPRRGQVAVGGGSVSV